MDEHNDLILGCYDWLNYKQLAPWVNSIKYSGFKGDIGLIAFNSTMETVDKLVAKEVSVIAMDKDAEQKMFVHKSNLPLQTEQYFHFFKVLEDNAHRYRHVILTDPSNTIFQANPSAWLENHLEKRLLVSSDNVKYKDSVRDSKNMEQCFGPYFNNYFKHNTVYNSGVIAGESEYIRDFCMSIFMMATNRPVPICDQTVMNVLLHTRPYQDVTMFVDATDTWCCNLHYEPNPTGFIENPPRIEYDPEHQNEDVLTDDGRLFTIIHGYNAMNNLEKEFQNRFGDVT